MLYWNNLMMLVATSANAEGGLGMTLLCCIGFEPIEWNCGGGCDCRNNSCLLLLHLDSTVAAIDLNA